CRVACRGSTASPERHAIAMAPRVASCGGAPRSPDRPALPGYSPAAVAETEQLVETPKPNFVVTFVDHLFDPVLGLLDDVGGTATLLFQSLTWLVRPPLRIAQLLVAIEFIGAGSLFIAGLVGVFTGMAFTLSSIIGFRQFGAEGMVGGVVALALARELAPV